MGKSRRNRRSNRSDPAGARTRPVKAPADPELAALRTGKILPVVQDLKSADPKTRTSAAGAVSNLVADAKCRKLLLREQVVHTVLQETLADSSLESRAAGWEILNVLAQHEEADFCVHLFRCDVLTPAAHALTQLVASFQPAAKPTKAEQDFAWRLAGHVLDLIIQLADARDEILVAVASNTAIVQALFSILTNENNVAVPAPVRWSAVTGLARLCEAEDEDDNDDKEETKDKSKVQRSLAEALVDDQTSGGCYAALRSLQEADSNSSGALAVAACSLLHAVFATLEWFDHSPGRDQASDAILVPTLARAVEKAASEGKQQKQNKKDDEDTVADNNETAELALQTLAMIATTVKTSLEKGNREASGSAAKNAGSKKNGNVQEEEDDTEMMDGVDIGDEDEKTKEEKEGEDDDDDDDMDMDMDMENVTGADEPESTDRSLDDIPTLRALVGVAVPPIVQLIRRLATDANAFERLPLLLDALATLNNLAWTVACVDLEDDGNAAILRLWKPAAARLWTAVVEPLLMEQTPIIGVDIAVLGKTTALAWALARVLGGETPVEAAIMDHLVALQSLPIREGAEREEADQDPFQTLSVQSVGVLGQLAREPASLDRNRRIGGYLLDLLDRLPAKTTTSTSTSTTTTNTKTDVATAVEALNQLFDLYGDENAATDKAVFWADGFLDRLEAVLPKAKAAAKSVDKRTMGELRMRADEAVLNLNRFLVYKKKHKP